MDALQQIQKILDGVLLPKRILSHHIRRGEVDEISSGTIPRDDAYAVYRSITNRGRVYGNGKQKLGRISFDINYYYKNTETNAESIPATNIMTEVASAFVAKGWLIINDQTDLYDTDGGFKGINIEIALIGA